MKERFISILRWSERYTKTDMVYLVKNSLWLNLNTILSSLFSLLLSVAFARYVSKDAFGSYQFLVSLASILGTLTLTGMNAAVTQAVARGFEGVYKESIRIQLRYAAIPFGAGLIVSAYYFFYKAPEISISLIFIAILLPIINTLNTWTAYVSGKKEFFSYFTQNQRINIIYYVVMMVCIFASPRTTPLIVVNFLALTLGNWLAYKYTLKRLPNNGQKEVAAISYGKKLSLSNILPLVALHIDNLLVFHYLGAANLAIYTFASNVPERFMSLIRPISTLAFPKMSAANHEEFRSRLSSKLLQYSALAAIMCLAYIVIAPYFYRVLFPLYAESVKYSQVYIIAAAISSVASLSISFIFASRSNKIFSFNIANPIFNIGVIIGGAILFGIWGVIGARIVGNIFSLAYSYYLERKVEV